MGKMLGARKKSSANGAWLAATAAATAVVLLTTAAAGQLAVPQLTAPADEAPAWLVLAAEQRVASTPPDEADESAARVQVRQYFSFKNGGQAITTTTTTTLQEDDAGSALTQLTADGRYYLVTRAANGERDDNELCQLDHRHDHGALFPWRHAPPRAWHQVLEGAKRERPAAPKEARLAGLAGLWLNLAEDKRVKCKPAAGGAGKRNQVSCSTESASKSLAYSIEFAQTEAGHLRYTPTKARVQRQHAISADSSGLKQQVSVELEVGEFRLLERAEALELEARFEQLAALCRRPQELAVFPSLQRELAESERRAYFLDYSLELFETGQTKATRGGRPLVASQARVQEWFSYELAVQTIVRSLDATHPKRAATNPNVQTSKSEESSKLMNSNRLEKYLRVFGVMRDASVNYKLDVEVDTRDPLHCQFGSLDADRALAAGSPLLRRPLEFRSIKGDQSPHRGHLIGLGALLMNVAELYQRQASARIATGADEAAQEPTLSISLTERNQLRPLVEWRVDDDQAGQRWFFYFKKPTLKRLEQHEGCLGELSRIEWLERPQQNASAGAFSLIMALEVHGFSSSFYQDELDRAFSLAPICPEAVDVVGPPATAAAPEIEFQQNLAKGFPSFYDTLGLEQNYKINSRWRILRQDGTLERELQVSEYFALETRTLNGQRQGEQLDRALFSRLDVMGGGEALAGESKRYFLYHSINVLMVCQDAHEECVQVNKLDGEWLAAMSSELVGFQFDVSEEAPAGGGGGAQLRHLGVGALWALASRSALLETCDDEAADEACWQLRDEQSMGRDARISLHFRRDEAVLVLNKLQVDSSQLASFNELGQARALEVDRIAIERGGAQLGDFELPDYCRDTQTFVELNLGAKLVFALAPDERRAHFLTLEQHIKQEGGGGGGEQQAGSLRQLDFKLEYELIISSFEERAGGFDRRAERRLAATEINSVQQRRGVTLLQPGGGGELLRFWALEHDIQLLEQVARSNCKQAPELRKLFQLDEYLHLLAAYKPDSERLKVAGRQLDFLLAELWRLMGERVFAPTPEQPADRLGNTSALELTTRSVSIKGERAQLIRWSLYETRTSSLIVFEFLKSPAGRMRLSSVSLAPGERASRPRLRFALKSRVSELGDAAANEGQPPDEVEQLQLRWACNVQFHKLQAMRAEGQQPEQEADEWFPRLSKMLDGGELLPMRSELVVSETQNLKRAYLLDEWLQLDRGYRARLRLIQDDVEPLERELDARADLLANLTTGEFFDLSTPGECQLSALEAGGSELRGAGEGITSAISSLPLGETRALQLVARLFPHAAFYGPVSLWLLAERLNKRQLRDNQLEPMAVWHLFEPLKLTRWFAADFWLVEHPHEAHFWFQLTFAGHNDIGRHATILKRADASDWRAAVSFEDLERATGADKPRARVSCEVINYKFDTRELRNGRLTDEAFARHFRLPKGFGCRRNELAKRQAASSSDVIVFESLSPLEFDYEASLALAEAADLLDATQPEARALKPAQVLQTGWFARCPSTWNAMLIGSLRVNWQQQHFLNGTRAGWTRVAARDAASSSTLIRLIDESRGTCSIERLQAEGDAGSYNSSSADEQALENEAELLVLDFVRHDGQRERVRLPASWFAGYERGAERQFERIQEFDELDGDSQPPARVLVYESRRSELQLNARLKGAGSLIKTFRRTASATKSLKGHHYHSSFQLEVLIPHLAHLSVRVSNLQFRECFDIMRAAKARDCHLDTSDADSAAAAAAPHNTASPKRLRNFRLKFELDSADSTAAGAEGALASGGELFASQKLRLERQFVQLLLMAPGAVAPMQLGQLQLNFEPHDGRSLWIHFELLEPANLRHSFRLLDKHALKQRARDNNGADDGASEQTGQLAVASSLADCADQCERQARQANQKCLAFSYCRDRSCQTLTLRRTSANNSTPSQVEDFKRRWLEPNWRAHDECQVYHSDPGDFEAERRHLDEVAAFLRRQVEGPLVANKFALTLKVAQQMGALKSQFRSIRLVARHFDELEAAGEDDEPQRRRALPPFVLVGRLPEGQLQAVATKLANLNFKLAQAANLEGCHAACQSCSLHAYCPATRLCTLATNPTSWAEYRAALNLAAPSADGGGAGSCALYARNFLASFAPFEQTRAPSEFASKALNFNQLECAAFCKLASSKELQGAGPECLSFDFCQPPGARPACYLQTMHVIMDDFDAAILRRLEEGAGAPLGKRRGGGGGGGQERAAESRHCAHWSRSLVEDFEVERERRFERHHSLTLKGSQLEHCALICRRDQTCLAFEFCRAPTEARGACYLERAQSQEPAQPGDGIERALGARLLARECSIYALKKRLIAHERLQGDDLAAQLIHQRARNVAPDDELETPEANSAIAPGRLAICALLALKAGLLLGAVLARRRRRAQGARRRAP